MSRWSSIHLSRRPISRSTIHETEQTHTQRNTQTLELPVSIHMANYCTECENTVVLHGVDGKKSVCVCKGNRMKESVSERERKIIAEWKKQGGSIVGYPFIKCQHVFIICWISLMESMGVAVLCWQRNCCSVPKPGHCHYSCVPKAKAFPKGRLLN